MGDGGALIGLADLESVARLRPRMLVVIYNDGRTVTRSTSSPLFRRLVPMLDRVATGFTFTEGPVWRGDDLLFSDIPNSRTIRYRPLPEGPEITTFRHPTGNANGLTLDRQGNLIACEHTTRRVTLVGQHGRV